MPSKEHLKGILFGNRINMIVIVVIWSIYLSTFLLTQTLYNTYVEYVIADKASINNTLVARSPDMIYPVEDWGDGTLFRWNSGQVQLKILPVRYQYMMISSAIMAYDDKDFVANITYSNPQYIHVDGIKSGFRTYHLIFLPTPQNWSLGNKYSFSIDPTKNNSIPIVNDRKLALAISYINIKSVSNDLQLVLFEVVFSILWILLMYFMSYQSKIDNIFLSRLLIPAVVFHICAYHAFLGLERYLLYLIIFLVIIFFDSLQNYIKILV